MRLAADHPDMKIGRGEMGTVEIRWSATEEYDDKFERAFAKEHTTIIPGEWADCEANAESAVSDVIEDYFQEEEWAEQFGADQQWGCALVDIHAPPSIAGRYKVDVERVVKASVVRNSTITNAA